MDGVIVSAFREDLGDSDSTRRTGEVYNDLVPADHRPAEEISIGACGVNGSSPEDRRIALISCPRTGVNTIGREKHKLDPKQDFQPIHVATSFRAGFRYLYGRCSAPMFLGLGSRGISPLRRRRLVSGCFGTEFRVRAVFFLLNRDISVSLENKILSGRRWTVQSNSPNRNDPSPLPIHSRFRRGLPALPRLSGRLMEEVFNNPVSS